MHRFFAPALDPGDEIVSLPRDEAEHLTRVLRLSTGDTVSVFDGRGHEFLARRHFEFEGPVDVLDGHAVLSNRSFACVGCRSTRGREAQDQERPRTSPMNRQPAARSETPLSLFRM